MGDDHFTIKYIHLKLRYLGFHTPVGETIRAIDVGYKNQKTNIDQV